MNTTTPLIKLFIENNTYYMYDAVPNKLIKIPSKSLYFVLYKILTFGYEYINRIENTLIKYQIQKLVRQGFLQNPISNIEHPYKEYVHVFLERYVESLVLEITQNCNLKCRYCSFANQNSERSHSSSFMSKEIIQKSIDLYKRTSIDCPNTSISFYGGEPLLALPQIEYAMEYAERSFFAKPIMYNMTTNGTLLSHEVIDFLVKKDVNLMISFDGPKEVQNKNRRFLANGAATFNIVKNFLNYIERVYPMYYSNKIIINSVLLYNSDLQKAKDYFNNFNLPKNHIRINIANTEHIEFINEDIIDDLIVENDIKESKFNDVLNKASNVSEICHPSGPCVPGSKKLFVATNGNLYPCEKVNTSNPTYLIGNVFDGFYVDNATKLLDIGNISKERCMHCWAINFCSMCCAQCDGITTLDDDIKEQRCTITKEKALLFLKKYVKGGF